MPYIAALIFFYLQILLKSYPNTLIYTILTARKFNYNHLLDEILLKKIN